MSTDPSGAALRSPRDWQNPAKPRPWRERRPSSRRLARPWPDIIGTRCWWRAACRPNRRSRSCLQRPSRRLRSGPSLNLPLLESRTGTRDREARVAKNHALACGSAGSRRTADLDLGSRVRGVPAPPSGPHHARHDILRCATRRILRPARPIRHARLFYSKAGLRALSAQGRLSLERAGQQGRPAITIPRCGTPTGCGGPYRRLLSRLVYEAEAAQAGCFRTNPDFLPAVVGT
jgi:hypothetical protein